LRLEVWGRYLPNKVVVMAEEAGDKISQLVPLLRDRVMINSRPTAYVCQHYACNQPVTTREELSQQL